jgi:hypothetical protein
MWWKKRERKNSKQVYMSLLWWKESSWETHAVCSDSLNRVIPDCFPGFFLCFVSLDRVSLLFRGDSYSCCFRCSLWRGSHSLSSHSNVGNPFNKIPTFETFVWERRNQFLEDSHFLNIDYFLTSWHHFQIFSFCVSILPFPSFRRFDTAFRFQESSLMETTLLNKIKVWNIFTSPQGFSNHCQ